MGDSSDDTVTVRPTFEAIDVAFNQANDAWALQHLPWVRVATVNLRFSSDQLETNIRSVVNEDPTGELVMCQIENMQATAERLRTMATWCDEAVARLMQMSIWMYNSAKH